MNKRKKIIVSVLVIVVFLLGIGFAFRKSLAVVAFDLFLSDRIEHTLQEKSYRPIEGEEASDPVQYDRNPFSVLLIGSDQRGDEPARSDTLIYAVVRPTDAKGLLISIPRDTYAEMVGKHEMDKITHAYAFGGHKMTKASVEKLLNAEVHYYASINFQGLKDAVDALGGIELPIQKTIENKGRDHEKFVIEANKPLYNGQEALNYVRYREDSDYNRTKRQQVFLDVVAKRLLQVNQIGNVEELLVIMGDNFQTDMNPKMIIQLGRDMVSGSQFEFESHTLLGEAMRKNGVYYYEADEEDLKELQDKIAIWLNPDTPADQLVEPEAEPEN